MPRLRCLLALLAVAAIVSLLGAGEAHAQANNCNRGAPNPCKQITAVSDFALGTWNGLDNIVVTMRHCVRASGNSTLYSVTLTSVGASAGGNLRFTSGPMELPYSITYANADGSNATTITANGGSANGFTGVTRANQAACTSNPSATGQRMTLTITTTQLNSALAGSYSGTLQILIGPN